uniref:Uncharacterized protein n=1 Tax=Pipistrellus kuhlii TaxID=59472 RepID=A0A7J7Y905_PIPKU|nr:hypothetical protein mPipKuh1_010261 [Pipistrellus kuhlii]
MHHVLETKPLVFIGFLSVSVLRESIYSHSSHRDNCASFLTVSPALFRLFTPCPSQLTQKAKFCDYIALIWSPHSFNSIHFVIDQIFMMLTFNVLKIIGLPKYVIESLPSIRRDKVMTKYL